MDLEEGITYLRGALSLCPPGHSDRYSFLDHLATVVIIRFERSALRWMEDLGEGVKYHHEALCVLLATQFVSHSSMTLQYQVKICTSHNIIGLMNRYIGGRLRINDHD